MTALGMARDIEQWEGQKVRMHILSKQPTSFLNVKVALNFLLIFAAGYVSRSHVRRNLFPSARKVVHELSRFVAAKMFLLFLFLYISQN